VLIYSLVIRICIYEGCSNYTCLRIVLGERVEAVESSPLEHCGRHSIDLPAIGYPTPHTLGTPWVADVSCIRPHDHLWPLRNTADRFHLNAHFVLHSKTFLNVWFSLTNVPNKNIYTYISHSNTAVFTVKTLLLWWFCISFRNVWFILPQTDLERVCWPLFAPKLASARSKCQCYGLPMHLLEIM
jgi:hypothetical protein